MLSIIIPAYNEEKRIKETLRSYCKFLRENINEDFEIIVVVNNSTDNTYKVVKKLSIGYNEVRAINFEYRTGKGGAVIEGFREAKGDYIAFVDADDSTKPEEFFKIYKRIQRFDCVIASRKCKGAEIRPPRDASADISSWIFMKVIRLKTGLKFKDTQCGCKIFKRKVIDKILEYKFIERGWIFDVDLLNICRANHFSVCEYPINWKDSEGSKLTFTDSIKSILKLFDLPDRRRK